MDHPYGTAMASQTSVKSPQKVLGKLLTLQQNKLRYQVAGPPSVHHEVIAFKHERASESYGLHSGSPVTNALVLAIFTISAWLVQDRKRASNLGKLSATLIRHISPAS